MSQGADLRLLEVLENKSRRVQAGGVIFTPKSTKRRGAEMPGEHVMGGPGTRNVLWRIERYRRPGILADQVGKFGFCLGNQNLRRLEPRDFIQEFVNPTIPVELGCEEFTRTNIRDP